MTDNFDPTGEYLGDGWGILDNLRSGRSSATTTPPGAAGNKIVPDIATSVPKPTNGGKTYTFHLKPDIKFGPPVNRAITSQDFVTAMERLANPKDGGEYAFYYTVIKGWNAYAAGKAKTISGITTPNATTIVFNLTAPTGDFLYRMAMPATGPMPAEVTKCFAGEPGKYGQDLISTGPLHAQGDRQRQHLVLHDDQAGHAGLRRRRRPTTSSATRTGTRAIDPYSKNYPDEIDFTVDSSDVDIYNKVEAGQLDLATSTIPPDVLAEVRDDAEPEAVLPPEPGRPHLVPDDEPDPAAVRRHPRPPGDELDHRTRWRCIQAWGGPTVGTVANHIVPDTHLQQPARRVRAVRDAREHRQPRQGEGGDEGLEVRHGQQRHVRRAGVQERAHDLGHARGRPEDGRR